MLYRTFQTHKYFKSSCQNFLSYKKFRSFLFLSKFVEFFWSLQNFQSFFNSFKTFRAFFFYKILSKLFKHFKNFQRLSFNLQSISIFSSPNKLFKHFLWILPQKKTYVQSSKKRSREMKTEIYKAWHQNWCRNYDVKQISYRLWQAASAIGQKTRTEESHQ